MPRIQIILLPHRREAQVATQLQWTTQTKASRETSAPDSTQGRHIWHVIWLIIVIIMVDES
jgi:hypothetical protein